MEQAEGQICLPAQAQQAACRKTAMRRFRAFLADFDICVTEETFDAEVLGEMGSFQLACHLQAPTIYDVAVRLAKAGWIYTDETEDRAAPCLSSPDGEQVRITRHTAYAKLVFTPAGVHEWVLCIRQSMVAASKHAAKHIPSSPNLAVYQSTGS